MKEKEIICGFSKLTKDQKLDYISNHFENPADFVKELKSFNHYDESKQSIVDEFSENTVSNFFFPYGISPNFVIDGNVYHVPMVIEESSVIAAASKSAKFWSDKGGFHSEIISTTKIGQVHFMWHGNLEKLKTLMPDLKDRLIESTQDITANMQKRGGGIIDIELVDKTADIPDYYQIKATFETVDSMGANFINSCLEEFAVELKSFFLESPYFNDEERDCEVIMSILSNYTPDCLVKVWAECEINELGKIDEELTGEQFASKFEKAVRISQVDTYRATTHNKGIFNGIDAVALATGNDFRAIEACGHTYAARNGKYTSLTDVEIKNGKFRYTLTVPLALGTVGGLTGLHPLAKKSLELLGNPNARDLMRIAASVGLANNFGAIKSLVTKGIQKGHMKMHLLNILNQFDATEIEKEKAKVYFEEKKVSYSAVDAYIKSLREPILNKKDRIPRQIMKYYSHGKLLIAGEYLVLNGATSLTVPLTSGQSLEVKKEGDQDTLTWKSYEQDKLWFEGKFNTEFFDIIESTDQQISEKLRVILKKAIGLNPDFKANLESSNVMTRSEFKFHWGFGSSSTLLSNIAFWADVDPFELHLKTSSGSGYDVVAAREKGPIFFNKKKTGYSIEKVKFDPHYKDQIYFFYLGQKQDSAISVDQFKSRKRSLSNETKLISELSRHIASAVTLEDFEYYLKEHEMIISSVLKQKRVKEARFNDMEGEVKSLGAWGGDFAMMTWHDSKKKLIRYLQEKNIDTIFSFEELIKK